MVYYGTRQARDAAREHTRVQQQDTSQQLNPASVAELSAIQGTTDQARRSVEADRAAMNPTRLDQMDGIPSDTLANTERQPATGNVRVAETGSFRT